MPPEEREPDGLDVSVVVPLFNEEESLEPLHGRIRAALERRGLAFEIIFVDDGSTDGSLARLEAIAARDPAVRVVSFRRNYGKSAALGVAFDRARGRLVATCDADLQDDPAEIPEMMAMVDAGPDLVSGWKRDRRDPLSKRWASALFNWVVRAVSDVKLHDVNCGLKVYRRAVVRSIPVYGELHRFLPVLAAWQGFRTAEKVVRHEPRRHGKSKFGRSRFINGFLDLITVKFLAEGQHRPLHLFGRVAVVLLGVGGIINVWMLGIWIFEGALRSRPLLILGLVSIVLGIQFISIGLLGEMLAYQHRRRDYGIKREIG
jgi:glycosyltransferase involved in cell wall biosynthesis